MPKKVQMLLVDDDEMTLFIHRKILKRCEAPFEVFSFRSAEKCITHIQQTDQEPTFLVLLDINMPGMSGWEFLDRLKQDLSEREVLVIMATSSVDYDDRKQAEGYDCVIDFIEKPFNIDTCKEIIALPQLA